MRGFLKEITSILVLALIVAIIGISGCTDSSNSTQQSSDNDLTPQQQQSSEIRKIEDSKAWNQSLENFKNNFLPKYYYPEDPTLDTLYIYDISENGTELKVAVVMINYHTRIRDDWGGLWIKKDSIWVPSSDFKIEYKTNIDTGKDYYMNPSHR